MNRRPIIAGNWKMNLDPRGVRGFFAYFNRSCPENLGVDLLLFPPSISFNAAMQAKPDRPAVALGIQNIHWEAPGAFTGEISASMAKGAGATHVLVGHSERRHLFGETNEEVGKKVAAVLKESLIPVVCVGETLEERKAGRLQEVILEQLEAFLLVLQAHPGASVLLAYEPVWAIGTGETATPEDAAQAHGILRARLVTALGVEEARDVPILYGGSVKPGNARELMASPDVDGVLVGGASLDPESFQAIAEAGAPPSSR